MAQDIITRASHIILPEFVADVPNIEDRIKETIDDLLVETNRSTKKLPRKRKSETPNTTLAPKIQKKMSQKWQILLNRGGTQEKKSNLQNFKKQYLTGQRYTHCCFARENIT